MKKPYSSAVGSGGFEKTLAKLYVYLIVIRMASGLTILQSVAGAMANYFDFILVALGLFLMVISNRGILKLGNTGELIKGFALLIFLLNTISLIWAVIYGNKFGTIDGEDTFAAVIPIILYYFQYLLLIIYNNHIFGLFTKREIWIILRRVTRFLLVLGYIQIAICIIGGPFALAYDAVNYFGIFRPSSYLITIDRIPLCGVEPAAAGEIIGLLVFPLLLSRVINEGMCAKNMIEIALWIPVILYTKSTTCYLSVCVLLFVFLFLYSKYSGNKGKGVLVFLLFALILLSLVIISDWGMSFLGNNEYLYLLFNKVTDRGNESTVTRTIPTYINFKIFSEYPFGIGNGNQGFFYKSFFPSWGSISINTFNKIVGVADGGVFIPSLFSGYGVLGIAAFCIYLFRHFCYAKNNKNELGVFYFIFVMALAVFLINGFQADYFGKIYAWFIFSIPFMTRCRTTRLVS